MNRSDIKHMIFHPACVFVFFGYTLFFAVFNLESSLYIQKNGDYYSVVYDENDGEYIGNGQFSYDYQVVYYDSLSLTEANLVISKDEEKNFNDFKLFYPHYHYASQLLNLKTPRSKFIMILVFNIILGFLYYKIVTSGWLDK